MATSYPDKTNARGIWRITDITRNIKTEGTFPGFSGSHKGLYFGGSTPSDSNVIQSVDQTSTGDGVDFGDLSVAHSELTTGANGIRALAAGLGTSVDTVLFASQGNSSNFATLAIDPRQYGSCSNNTRSLFHGNGDNFHDTVEYCEFATLGVKADFGNLSAGKDREGACSSPTRGVWAGGETPGGNINVIEFVEIATTGNAVDFGDLASARRYPSGTSSNIKGLMAAGYTDAIVKNIDSFQIASTGNGVDYGDLSTTRFGCGTLSNNVRGIFAAGVDPSRVNTMDFGSFSSAGTLADFGDLVEVSWAVSGASPLNGGIDQNYPRTPELHSPTGRPLASGGGVGNIGIFAGGEYGYTAAVGYVIISTLGNENDFGDLVTATSALAGASSSTRCLTGGGQTPSANVVTINYAEFSSKGNFADFGDLTSRRDKLPGCSNDTRGVWGAGRDNSDDNALANIIDYVVIATIGNASDFGDATVSRQGGSGTASTTRGLFGGGFTPSYSDVIDYITIGSTGNASDFGDLTVARGSWGNDASSATRATFAGGQKSSNSNVIDYVTIASAGDATDFGDLEIITSTSSGSSNSTRGVYSGFNNTGATGADGTFGNCPHISYITIASTGNSTDFGDLTHSPRGTSGRYAIAAASNGHGGLA